MNKVRRCGSKTSIFFFKFVHFAFFMKIKFALKKIYSTIRASDTDKLNFVNKTIVSNKERKNVNFIVLCVWFLFFRKSPI